MGDAGNSRIDGRRVRWLVGVPCEQCGPTLSKVRFCRICGVKVCLSCFLGAGCHSAAMRGIMLTHVASERLSSPVPAIGRTAAGNS